MKNAKLKMVVGMDFSGPSDVALSEALRFVALGAVAELHAVYAVDPRDLPEDPTKPPLTVAEEVLDRAPDHVRLRVIDMAAASDARLSDIETFVHVRIGDHAQTIHQVAVDYDADLIVVGSNNRGRLDRWVLGSVSEKLVRTAHCPVIVVRPKDFEGLAKTPKPDAPYAPGQAPKYAEPHDVPMHMATQRVEWSSSEREGPTGVRIV